MTMGEVPQPGDAFVGRERELAELRRMLARALRGRGALTLLSGEVGFGKTSVAEVLAGEASDAGARVLWGRSSEAGGAPPYWPWVQVVRAITRETDSAWLADRLGPNLPDLARLAPEIERDLGVEPGQGADTQGARFRTFEAVTDLLRLVAREHGAIVVLEDLHWADGASLRLLDHISGEAAWAPLLVVATYRPDEPGPELSRFLPSLRRAHGANELQLDGLSLGEVTEYVVGVLGEGGAPLAQALYERTEGHPFFLVELVRWLRRQPIGELPVGSLTSVLPISVRAAVGRRLAQLSDECTTLLEIASVLGKSIPLGLLQTLMGGDRERVLELIEEARAASILVAAPPQPDALRFAHALLREVLYTSLPVGHRVELHRRVAEALESSTDPEAHAAELAHHWFEAAAAGDTVPAELWAVRAARAASATLAWEESARLYRVATELADRRRAVPSEVAGLLVERATAEWRAGEVQASLESSVRAGALAHRAGRPDLLAAAALVVHGVGDERIAGTVIRLCRDALAELPPTAGALRAALLGRLALALAQSGDLHTAAPLIEQALGLAEELGDPDALGSALHARQLALVEPHGVDERAVLSERMLSLAATTGRLDRAMWGHVWRAAVMFERGDASGIDRELRELERVAAASREPLARWHFLRTRAVREHMLGRFQAARQSWETAYSMAIRGGDTSASSLHIGFTSVLARETGDFDEHRQILRDMSVESTQQPPILATLLALVKVEEGALEVARVEYERLRPLYPTMERGARWIIAVAFFGELAATFGDREVATSTHEALLPFARLFNASGAGGVLCTAPVAYYLGLLTASLDRPDEAGVHLRSAIDLSHRAGAPGFAARAQHALALITRPKDPAGALALADAASVTAEVLGMQPLYEQATALIAELAPAAQAVNRLSRREQEVAAMLARGLSNRLIAETLVLSPRTVESHVQSILMKLGLTSRTQVAAWALANGLTQK